MKRLVALHCTLHILYQKWLFGHHGIIASAHHWLFDTILSFLSQDPPRSSQKSPGNTSNGKSGPESPKPARKRFGSTSDDGAPRVNGLGEGGAGGGTCPGDLDRLKEEIMDEMRKELDKVKQDIIEGKANFQLKFSWTVIVFDNDYAKVNLPSEIL